MKTELEDEFVDALTALMHSFGARGLDVDLFHWSVAKGHYLYERKADTSEKG